MVIRKMPTFGLVSSFLSNPHSRSIFCPINSSSCLSLPPQTQKSKHFIFITSRSENYGFIKALLHHPPSNLFSLSPNSPWSWAGPLFHFCSDSGNYTKNSPYESNLKKLISSLIYKTPSTGFALTSVGQYQYQAYSLSLCRGDVSSSDCKTCVADASSEIVKRCPYNKGGIIWYDNCMFKYLDNDFFGQIDDKNKFYMWNLRNVSDPAKFNYKTKDLLTELAKEASGNSKLYATGEVKLGESKKLYGLTQCTRDLSSADCKKCLEEAIGELSNCCDGKEGGRVVGGSCNFRYEIYPFVKE